MSTLSTNKKQFVICASPEQYRDNRSFIKDLSKFAQTIDFEPNLDIDHSIFIILGGDGSLNYLVNNLSDADFARGPEIIYMPTGTANDFARSLKIEPAEPFINQVESILRQYQFIDVPLMCCNDKKFINVASAGLQRKSRTVGQIS